MRFPVVVVSTSLTICAARYKLPDLTEPDRLVKTYPFYHSSDGLVQDTQALQETCKGLRVSFESAGSVSIPVAHVGVIEPTEGASGNTTRGSPIHVMMVFGEHAREIISPEAGLHFLRQLCGPDGQAIRRDTSFVMVLNANPAGRSGVEQGDYCKRTNENNVDLNRNYGYKWQHSTMDDHEVGVGDKDGETVESYSSGTGPFSEPETQVIAKLMKEQNIDVFLDVHSGTRGLFMPPDWTTDPLPNQLDKMRMQHVLNAVGKENCPECMIGDCSETVGYLSPGSSADYAYSQGIRFAFIWEIYADAADSAKDLEDHRRYAAQQKSSGFLQRAVQPDVPAWAQADAAELVPLSLATANKCLSMFNPVTQEDYSQTISRWSSAFSRLSTLVREAQTLQASSTSQ